MAERGRRAAANAGLLALAVIVAALTVVALRIPEPGPSGDVLRPLPTSSPTLHPLSFVDEHVARPTDFVTASPSETPSETPTTAAPTRTTSPKPSPKRTTAARKVTTPATTPPPAAPGPTEDPPPPPPSETSEPTEEPTITPPEPPPPPTGYGGTPTDPGPTYTAVGTARP